MSYFKAKIGDNWRVSKGRFFKFTLGKIQSAQEYNYQHWRILKNFWTVTIKLKSIAMLKYLWKFQKTTECDFFLILWNLCDLTYKNCIIEVYLTRIQTDLHVTLKKLSFNSLSHVRFSKKKIIVSHIRFTSHIFTSLPPSRKYKRGITVFHKKISQGSNLLWINHISLRAFSMHMNFCTRHYKTHKHTVDFLCEQVNVS